MIRSITRSLVSLVALVGLAGTAQAAYVPATWTDTFNAGSDPILLSSSNSLLYSHDLVPHGFNIGSDRVDNFSLTIDLFDDQDSAKETASIVFGGFLGNAPITTFSYQSADSLFSLFGKFELNVLGTLSVLVTSAYGDFYFGSSQLVANGVTQSVPEPSTLALLGIGLLGIAAGARRRKANVTK